MAEHYDTYASKAERAKNSLQNIVSSHTVNGQYDNKAYSSSEIRTIMSAYGVLQTSPYFNASLTTEDLISDFENLETVVEGASVAIKQM